MSWITLFSSRYLRCEASVSLGIVALGEHIAWEDRCLFLAALVAAADCNSLGPLLSGAHGVRSFASAGSFCAADPWLASSMTTPSLYPSSIRGLLITALVMQGVHSLQCAPSTGRSLANHVCYVHRAASTVLAAYRTTTHESTACPAVYKFDHN